MRRQRRGGDAATAGSALCAARQRMLSNIFVPTGGMPPWLRAIADWNPVSALAAAARQLFGNPAGPANGAWPLEHPVTASLAWTALLLAVFVPLWTTRYARPE